MDAFDASIPSVNDSFPDNGGVFFTTDDLVAASSSAPASFVDAGIFARDTPEGDETDGRGTPNGLELLVAIFFFVAAAWLLVAVIYALLALVVLKLRARGRLDIYEEDFGRFHLFGTRFYIPCGCILRRYVVAFGHDQLDGQQRSNYRYITRSERRRAVKKLLLENSGQQNNSEVECTSIDGELGEGDVTKERANNHHGGSFLKHPVHENDISTDVEISEVTDGPTSKEESQSEHCENHSADEPVCSICLTEYGKS